MRGNSTIMLGALGKNKASVCVSAMSDIKNNAVSSSCTSGFADKNNLTAYKLRILFTMLAFCLAMVFGGKAWGQTLTVNDGTESSDVVPFDGYNADGAQHNQMIYPATGLTAMSGKIITQMVFYIDQSASNGSNTAAGRLGTWTVSLGETAETTLSGLDNTTTLTQVYEGYFDCSTGTLTLEFDEGYLYNGGNLLVDLNHAAASWNTWYFLGENATGASYTYNSQRNFLPKTTFTYEDVPTCIKPTALTANNITHNTAMVSWSQGGEATNWVLEYSPNADFSDAISNNVNTTPSISLSGLNTLTTYYVRVKADCGGGDKSDWSTSISFSTTAEATLVGDSWNDDFEGATCGWEFINGNNTNAWTWGTAVNNGGTHALYISDDNGTTYEYTTGSVMVYATKLLNFATGKYQFSYNWKANGESTWDFMRVALVPASVTLTAGTTLPSGLSTTSLPSGWIALDGGSKLNLVNEWQTQELAINVAAGNYYLVFAWRNDNSGGTQPPAAVDNVSITLMTCGYDVINLAVSDITTSGATLEWTAGEASQLQVAYSTSSDFTGATEEIVNAATYHMTSLASASKYYVKVRAYCGGSDYGAWSSVLQFQTACDVITTFPWSEDFSSLSSGIPACWDNSEGTTNNESYKWNYYATGHEGACLRFNSYSNSSNNTNMLKTPAFDLTVRSKALLKFWYKNPAGGDFSVYISTDGGTTYDTELATGLTGVSTWTEKTIDISSYCTSNNVVIVFKGTSNCGYNDAYIYLDDISIINCVPPTIITTSSTVNTIAIEWTAGNGENAWQYCLNGGSWIDLDYNAGRTYSGTITGLDEATTYSLQIRSDCGSNGFSVPTSTSFTTEVACPVPTGLTSANITASSALVSWDNVSETSWKLQYKKTSASSWTEVIVVPTNNYTLVGLDESSTYEVQVQADCGSEGLSNWTSSVTFTTIAACAAPTALAASNVTARAADLSWTGASETNWVLQYGTDNTFADRIEVNVSTNPAYSITGLTPETEYFARVKAICGVGNESEWSDVYSFTPTAIVTIGTGTATENVLPTYTYYNYSMTQQIYTVAEIGSTAGNITSIDFYASAAVTRTLDIYMVATNKGTFTSGSDWIPVSSGDLVFNGEVTFAADDWTTITLNNPFIYDGIYNVAIIVDDNTGSYENNKQFRVFDAVAQAIRFYSDSDNQDPLSPTATGTIVNKKNQIRFHMEDLPSCVRPSALAVSNINTTTADLSWTRIGSETAWQICINGDEDNLVDVTANPYTLTGLTPETEYTVKIRANCGGGDYSAWSSAIEFKTACEAITSYPWNENFDGYTVPMAVNPTARTLPSCWTYINTCTHNTYKYYPTLYSSFSNSNPNNLRFKSYYTQYTDYDPQPQYAILPPMENLNGKRIKLWARGDNANCTFKIGIMTDPMDVSTFELIGEELALTTSYQKFTINLTGTGNYIAIMIDAASSSRATNAAYIDDIIVEEIPSCVEPSNLSVSSITARTADLTWTSGGSEPTWQICLNNDENNLIEANTNPFTLTGLTPETDYTVKVRAICAVDDVSAWSDIASFTTDVACHIPTDLAAVLTQGNGTIATLSWTENGTATDWVLEYGTASDFAGAVSEPVTGTPSANLTGLTAETTYYARVKAVCGGIDGESEWSATFSFEPTDKYIIGSATATSNYLPTHSMYDYSLTQQIYTAAEIGTAGYISSIDFYNVGTSRARTLDIYIVSTDKTTFANGSDWISVNDDDMVYSGTVTFAAGVWSSIPFSSDFYYNGTSNLAVIVDDNTGSWESGLNCDVFNADGQAIYKYQDNTNFDPENPGSYSGTVLNAKNQIRLAITPGVAPACDRPTGITVSDVAITTATISWTAGGNEDTWNIGYKTDIDPDWTEISNVTTPFTIEDLIPDTHYEVRVQANCRGNIGVSNWSRSASFTTLPNCPAPTNLSASVTATSATISWTAGFGESVWNLRYKVPNVVAWTVVNGVTNPYTIENLNPETSYEVQVQSKCTPAVSSAWTNSYNFYTGYCAPTPSSKDGKGIIGVSFGAGNEVVNNTDANGLLVTAPFYGNFSNLVGAVNIGLETTVSITYATGYTYGTIIWIDFNDNLVFDGNEVVYVGMSENTNPTVLEATFTLPASTPLGQHRMRIIGSDSGYDNFVTSISAAAAADPCPTGTYTIVHDYTINVLDVPSCLPPTNIVATNITISGATISWTENSNETEWELQYSTSRDFASYETVNVSTNPTADITSLTDATTYYVRVKANCGGDYSYWSAIGSFLTACGVFTVDADHQFAENFAGVAETFPPLCWSQERTEEGAGSGTDYPDGAWASYTYTQGTGSNPPMVQLRNTKAGSKHNLVTKALSMAAGDYVVSLRVYRNATGSSSQEEGINVYVSKTDDLVSVGNDAADLGFISRNYAVQSSINSNIICAEAASGWYKYEIPFTIESDGVYYVIFEGRSQYGGQTYMDDVVVKVAPTCAKPTNLVITDRGLNDVTLEWIAGGAETMWNIQYKKVSEQAWTTNNGITSTTYTVTGLLASTSYEFQVQADCGGDYSEWTDAVSTTTKYGIVFLEQFASTAPADWNQYTGHLSNVMNGTPLASGSGWIFNSGNGVFNDHARVNIYGGSCYKWLTTPTIVMEPNVQLTFDLALTAYSGTLQPAATSGLDDKFVVLISTDGGATWTILRQYDNVGSTYVYNNITLEGEEVAIDLTSYGNDEVIIAFYGESTESNADNNLHIDNVMLDYIPTCFKPTGLAVVATTLNTATIEWTPTGAEPAKWQYRLNGDGGTWEDLNGVTGTANRTATITGLTQATVYTVEVRAYCSDSFNDQSRPSTAVSFYTSLCDGGDMCEIRYELTDSEGDGWEGNAINVVDALTGIILDTWTVASGEASAEGTLSVCDGRELSFVWENGNSAEDCSYIVYDRNDEEIFSGEDAFDNAISHTVSCQEVLCRKPRNLTVSNITATSAQISWVPNGNSALWEYKKNDGDWTQVTTTHINLTNLTAGETYTVMVRTVCESGPSEARSVSFVTGDMCEISYELTDSYGDGWNGAAINVVNGMTGTIIDTWTIASGRSATGTLPIIDGSTITFQWVSGNYDSECSYVIKDVNGNAIISGTGAIASGIVHTVDCPDCARPRNLVASDVTTTSATISWEAGSATNWTIQYSTNSSFSTVLGSVDVNVPQKEFTGLTAETTYYFRVKAVCGAGEESDWSNVCEVTPSVCRRIGSGTAVNADLPAQSYYNYSYSQQIYTPAEIGSAGLLNGVSFFNNGTAQTRTINMYVVCTTKSTFTGTTDWIPVTAENLVYSGSVTFANGQWTQIDFTNAVEYDGTKNVVVIVDDNTGSYQSAMSCLAFNAAGNQALHIRNDNTNYDPENASFAGTLSSTKNQVRFCITGCEDRSGNLAFIATPARINVGGTVNLSSNTYLTNTASPSGTIQWSSSDTRIATVDSDGVVTGLSAGKATITATLPSVFDGLTLYCAMQAEYNVIVDCNTLTNPDCFDFEDYTSANDLYYQDAGIPSCWRRIYSGTYAEGAPHAYNGYFAMDGNAIEITSGNYQLYGQNYGYTNYVVMPYISGMENGGMITFNAWWQYVDYGTLTVGYMTDPDDAATFVEVANAAPFLYNFGSATAGLNQISLPSMPAGAYIAFRWVCETDYFCYSVAIDNVCICSAVAGAFGLTQTSGTVLVTQTFDDLSSFINNQTNVPGRITYSTSNPTIAIVDENGIITGTSVGEATITVTFTPEEAGKCQRTADFVVIVGSEQCREIGNATTTTYRAPVNNKYNYTYTQLLFKQNEINATGLITSISFQYAYNRPMTAKNSVKMYLKETDKEAFSGTNDWVLDVTEADLVYSGALNCSQGWNSYFLDVPFPYSGRNLLLVIDDNSANNNGESYVFDYTETNFNSVISYYNDNNNYGNNNISGHSRLCERTRPNTKFCIYDGSACTIVYDASTNCMNDNQEHGVSNAIASTHAVTGYPTFVTSDLPSCSIGLFLGWDTNPTPDQTDPSYEPPYAPGAYIASAHDMTLYAIYRICDYVKIVKEGRAYQGIADGGVDSDGIQKFNVCEGEVLTLEAQKKPNVHDNVNITYSWDVNRHDGRAHVKSNESSVTYEATTTMGHDILLKIDGHDGCKQEIPLRVWVSHGLRTTYDNPFAGNICVGKATEIIVGDPDVVPDAMIEVDNEALEIKSTQGVSTTKFIPDGVGECYTSDVEFADFKENAVITDASNIDYVKINLEHSHIGDVQISLKCYTPNYEPRTAILLQDQKNSAGGGLDNATYAWPYLVVRCYASFDRYINNQYSSGGCQQGRLDRQNVSMPVYVGYNGTSTGIRQEGRAFDRNMTIAELLAELQAMLRSTSTNTPSDFCAGGYYYKFRGWVNNNPANYYSSGSSRYGGYGSNYATQWYTEAASLGFGKPDMHDGLSNYILTPSYNPSGEGLDYCWSNSDSYQYAAADGNIIDNANHERGYTNALIAKPSNVSNGTQFYHPYQSFQSLVGCKLNGVWTIQICDSWGLDNGYIFSWEIGLKDIDDNAWSYDIELVDSHMGNCGGFDSGDSGNTENLISEINDNPDFYIHPTIANMESLGITLPSYPASLTRSCELVLVDNIGCETTGNAFTYDISQPAIPHIASPEICLGEQAHVQADLGGSGMVPGSQSMFKWWTLPEGETDWVPLTDQGVTNPVNGETAAEFYYIPTRSGDRFRAEIYDAHGCGGIIDDIIITNLPDIANAAAYDYIWHGKYLNTTSNDWNSATNWYVNNGGGSYSVGSTSLPTTGDNVYIGESQCTKTNDLSLSNNAYAKNLTIGSGASLTVTAGTGLSIAGNLENIGTLNANEVAGGAQSYVFFVGSEDQSITNAQTFRNVEFSQSGIYNITADNGITVDGSATFTKGILTGNATFNENATASVRNYSSYVDGTVVKKGNPNSFTFPTGNDGVLGAFTTKIENNTSSGMSVKFNHKHGDGTDESGFSSDAPDYYPEWWSENDMCSDNDPQLDHVSNFEYWKVDNLGANTNLTNLTLKVDADHPTQHFHDGVSDYSAQHIVAAAHYDCWKNLGRVSTTVAGSHSTITITNINSIPRTRGGNFDGIVTLGSIDRATLLPIELTALSANCNGKSVLVEWTTATERNNDYFIIERSDDAINFVEIARVAGAGNSIEPIDYSYSDYGRRNGDNYYRLVQVDYDGTRSASEIVVAFCFDDNGEEPEVMAYPNPFNNELTIELENFGNRPTRIDVFDMLGKLVYTEAVDDPQNSYSTLLQFGELPPSTYNVRVSTSDFVINRKVVKN